MSTLFEKSAKISHVVTLSVEKARALEDPIRATMLDLLSRKTMSVENLINELRKKGKEYDKAPTTIRHHLDFLKKAGLVELVKAEEAGGAVLKYYAARARFLGYEPPQDFGETFEDVIANLSKDLLDVIRGTVQKHGDLIGSVVEKLKPCPQCARQHFEEYVLVELLHRAVAEVTGTKGFRDLLDKI